MDPEGMEVRPRAGAQPAPNIPEVPLADRNNNLHRNDVIPPFDPDNNTNFVIVGIKALPPVSTMIALLQVFLYFTKEYLFNIQKEEDIYVSWKMIFEKGYYWRLLVAHFFHFGKVHLFLNVITIVSIGRYLEKKITQPALLIGMELMGIVSNLLYIYLNGFFCSSPHSEYTFGFSNVFYSLRIVLAYVQEPRNYEIALAYGLWPMELSAVWAPWQPLLEVLIVKVVVPELCMTGSISGILTGFIFSFLILLFPTTYIELPDAHEEE